MLLAPRYHDVDLPVYPPDAPVIFNICPANIGDTVGPTILKAARVEAPRLLGRLGEILSRTDKELEQAARLCGAAVLDHEWGLFPLKHHNIIDYAKYVPKHAARLGMPKDHLLVAKVPLLKNVIRLDQVPDHAAKAPTLSVLHGIAQYAIERRSFLIPQLDDLGIIQFTVPDRGNEVLPANVDRTLTDIEPIWSYRQRYYWDIKHAVLPPLQIPTAEQGFGVTASL